MKNEDSITVHHHYFPPLLLVFMGQGNHVGGSS